MKVQVSLRQRSRGAALFSVCMLALALLVVLAGCDLFGGGATTAQAPSDVALNQLPWCDKPLVDFQDNSTTSQATLTNWNDVKDQLGFSTYLPKTLPKGSCLVLAGGSIHDPIFGGLFRITYDLPNSVPISFSEGPKRPGISGAFSCTQNTSDVSTPIATPATPVATTATLPTPTPGVNAAICSGAIANTSISIASLQTQIDLQTTFKSLQPDVDWVPTNTTQLLATPSPTGTTGK